MKFSCQLVFVLTLFASNLLPLPAQPSQTATAVVATPLGSSALILTDFQGTEALSELFHFQVEVVTGNRVNIPFEAVLGREVSITFQIPGEAPRVFSGICSRISQGDRGSLFTSYRMEIVPQLWLLTLNSRSRIFQQLSVPEILRQVFNDAGLNFEMNLTGFYHPRNYVTRKGSIIGDASFLSAHSGGSIGAPSKGPARCRSYRVAPLRRLRRQVETIAPACFHLCLEFGKREQPGIAGILARLVVAPPGATHPEQSCFQFVGLGLNRQDEESL